MTGMLSGTMSKMVFSHVNVNKGLTKNKLLDLWSFLRVENIKLGFFTETGPPLFDIHKRNRLLPGYNFKLYNSTVNKNCNGILCVWDTKFFGNTEVVIKCHKDTKGYNGNILSVIVRELQVCFVCVYAPNESKENWEFIQRIFVIFKKLQRSYKTIIVGDLNVTANLDNRLSQVMPSNRYIRHSQRVMEMFDKEGVYNLQEEFDATIVPTRKHPNGTETTIDYVLASKRDNWNVDFCVKLPVTTTVSDHCPIVTQIRVELEGEPLEGEMVVNINNINDKTIVAFKEFVSEKCDIYSKVLLQLLRQDSINESEKSTVNEVTRHITEDVLEAGKKAFGTMVKGGKSPKRSVKATVPNEWYLVYKQLKWLGKAMEVVRKMKFNCCSGIQLVSNTDWDRSNNLLSNDKLTQWGKSTPMKLFVWFREESEINKTEGIVFIKNNSKVERMDIPHDLHNVKGIGVFGTVSKIIEFLSANAKTISKARNSYGYVFGDRSFLLRFCNNHYFKSYYGKSDFRRTNTKLAKTKLEEFIITKDMNIDEWQNKAMIKCCELQILRKMLNDKMVEESRANAFKFQRKLFYSNRKKLAKLLYEDKSGVKLSKVKDGPEGDWITDFDVVKQKVVEFWAKEANNTHEVLDWCWKNLCSHSSVKDHTVDEVNKSIAISEIYYSLFSKGDKSAPGPDLLTYQLLKNCPQIFFQILQALFNVLYKHNIIPDIWKIAKTILIPKKNTPELESDWRPITLQSAFFKTYTSILNKRLMRFMLSNSMISEAQNGFIPIDGCCDQTLLLQAALKDARTSRSKLFVLFVDFKNAYGRASHKAIAQVMERLNIPPKLRAFVKTKLEGCKFSLQFNGFESEPIIQASGVAQGDPNSPLEYIIFQEPLHRWIETQCKGYTFKGISDISKIIALKQSGYADDIVMLFESEIDLIKALEGVDLFCKWGGSALNGKKSGIMALDFKYDDPYCSIELSVNGSQIPCVTEYTYLGTVINAMGDASATCDRIDEKLIPKIEGINKSVLDPFQKVEMLRSTVLGTLRFFMSTVIFPPNYLDKWNKICRNLVRQWLGSRRIPNINIHLPGKLGGLGMTDLVTMDGVHKTALLAKKLCSKRDKVRFVTHMEFQQEQQSNMMAGNIYNMLAPKAANFLEHPSKIQKIRRDTASKGDLRLQYKSIGVSCICGFANGATDEYVRCNKCEQWQHAACSIPKGFEPPEDFWCANCVEQEEEVVEVGFHVNFENVNPNLVDDEMLEDTQLGLSWSERIPEWEADEMWDNMSNPNNKLHRLLNGQWWVDYSKVPPENAVHVYSTNFCTCNDDGSVNLDKEVEGLVDFLSNQEGAVLAVYVYNNLLYKILTRGWLNRWRYNFGRNSKGRLPIVWSLLIQLQRCIADANINITWIQDPQGSFDRVPKYVYRNMYAKQWEILINNQLIDPEATEMRLSENIFLKDYNAWEGSSSIITKSCGDVDLTKICSAYLFNANIDYVTRKVFFLARINAWPTNHRLFVEGQRNEEKCNFCDENETISHILCSCRAFKKLRMNKHDQICNDILSAMLAELNSGECLMFEVFYNEMLSIKWQDATYKPDIVIIHNKNWVLECTQKWGMHPDTLRKWNRELYRQEWENFCNELTDECPLVIIIEVTLCWDSNMEEKLNRKIDKYKVLCEYLKMKANNVQFIPVVIGALGTLNWQSVKQLNRLGLTPRNLKSLIKCIMNTICKLTVPFYRLRWCRNIQAEVESDFYPQEIV